MNPLPPYYTLDRQFFVDPTTGSDSTGDGSAKKPFASVGKADTAITVARYTRPTTSNDAILILAGGPYPFHWNQSVNNDNVFIGTYGTGRAILTCDQTGFSLGGHKGVHFSNIDLRVSSTYDHTVEGVGFNCNRSNQGVACDDVTFDGCCAWGFAQGISYLGDNGSKLRVWNGSYCNNYLLPANGIPNKSQGIYHEGSTADIRYNVMGFNGWAGNLNNPDVVNALKLCHGMYCSAEHNPQPGVSTGNFYVCNAASGLQMRTGGVGFGDVYVANGIACDAFTDGATGNLLGNVVLGYRGDAGTLSTGGGLLGQSDAQTIGGNYFLRSNPTTAAALLLGWNGSGNDITHSKTPSTTSTAALSGNIGVYAGPVSQVQTPRAFQTLDNNSISAPIGVLPDLLDWALTVGYTGPLNLRDLITAMRDNPGKYDAGAAIAWFVPIVKKLVAPSPVPPQPQPAPIIGSGVFGTTPFNMVKP